MSVFNPNELLLKAVRSVEEYDPNTMELTGRYSKPEEPSLKFESSGVEVTDAFGIAIHTFYNAQKGTFSFTNSLFSLDLFASQCGANKEIASASNKITTPISEVLDISSDHTVTLSHIPVGTTGAEVKFVKTIEKNNYITATYEVSATPGEGKFTVDAATKKITLPENATGRAFVQYKADLTSAVKVTKGTDDTPKVRVLMINATFCDPCNANNEYSGVIYCTRAQIDPSSVEVGLKPDSKHSVIYKLNKEYCDDKDTLCDFIVWE